MIIILQCQLKCFSYNVEEDPAFLEEVVEKVSYDHKFVKNFLTTFIPILSEVMLNENEIKGNHGSRKKRSLNAYSGDRRKSTRGNNRHSRQGN